MPQVRIAFPGAEGCRLALYEWALIVLPFFLESSELELELAGHLSRSGFLPETLDLFYLVTDC